jgi:uncharacterized protein (TIGR00299 family) protein
LGVDNYSSGPVATGTGMVQCAHGLMPIPAPGTAELLKGAPLRPSSIKAELTTPTGAAILTAVVTAWVEAPAMTVEKIGHGAGSRDLAEQPNVLRLFVGRRHEADAAAPDSRFEGTTTGADHDFIGVLETNLDDVPAEVVAYCVDLLFAAGALDVFTTPIYMKKNRPGVLLTALAPPAALGTLEEILFRETGTFGIRRHAAQRAKLFRKAVTAQTPWGPVQGKLGWLEGRPPLFAPEYEDCARLARAHGVPLREVYEKARQSYRP